MPLTEEELTSLGFDDLDDLKSLKVERDKWKTSHAEAEAKISQQGNELGTLRGRVGELETKGSTSDQNKKRPSGNEIDDAGKQVDEEGKTLPPTLQELKASMTKTQRDAVEVVYKALSDEDKARISAEESMERAFLEEAMVAVKPVRESLFEAPEDGSNETNDNEKVRESMRALFNKHVENKNVAPGSASPASITGLKPSNEEGKGRFNPPPREEIEPVGGSILEASKRRRQETEKT